LKMKSVSFVVLIGICIMGLATVSFADDNIGGFKRGDMLLTLQFGYNSDSPVFGASLEYGITENIGIGGSVMMGFWSDAILTTKFSQTLINPSLDAYYHFGPSSGNRLDIFIGLSLGYSIYSWSAENEYIVWEDSGSSGLYLSPIVGLRYYFSPKLILCAKSRYSAIGSFTGIGGEIGITFRLKK
jgi:hypothetical protein